ncbi:MAG TPA: hypothetical protein VHA30_00895, partial [Patescibacteria group bacterium]|nr:hypothetical protein [Patescibacteria group bacterium]
ACCTTGAACNSGYACNNGSTCSPVVPCGAVGQTCCSTSPSCVSGSTCSSSGNTCVQNAACGSSNGGSYSSAPTTGLCNSGTASAVSGSGPWTWTCTVSSISSTVSCSANKTAPTGSCSLSNNNLSFAGTAGDGATYSQTDTINNTQSASVTYTPTVNTNSGGNWLSVSPASQTVAANGSALETVKATTGSLAAGTYTGKAADSSCGTVNTTFVVTNSAVTLQSITVAPSSNSTVVGSTASFTATGHYSDGSTRDLTTAASWFSNNTGVATSQGGGVFLGVGTGNTVVTASMNGITSSGANLTVTSSGSGLSCDNNWHTIPSVGTQVQGQPAGMYVASVPNMTSMRDTIVVGIWGTDSKMYYQQCIYNGGSTCSWYGSWVYLLDGVFGASPFLQVTDTSNIYKYNDLTDYALSQNLSTLYQDVNIIGNYGYVTFGGPNSWTGWAATSTIPNLAWGKPFHFTDKNGQQWSLQQGASGTVQYNCGTTSACVKLPFNSSTSGLSSNSVNGGQAFNVVCDYNAYNDATFPVFKDGAGSDVTSQFNCSFAGFNPATRGTFNCTAPLTGGSYSASCTNRSGTADNVCAASNAIGTLTVSSAAGATPPQNVSLDNSVCGKMTVTWSAVSGATSYNVYRNTTGSGPTAGDIIAAGVTGTSYVDTSASGVYYYWVSSVGPSGVSQPQAPNTGTNFNPTAINACLANLTGSDKDIVAVNNASYVSNQCGGTDPLPAGTNLNLGDVLSFQINLCNDSGKVAASQMILTDTMTNLQIPTGSSNFGATYQGNNLTYVGACSGTSAPASANQYCSYGTVPNQSLVFNLSSSGDNIPAGMRGKLIYSAQLSVPTGFSGSSARFQNGFADIYNNGSGSNSKVTGYTPLLPFFTSKGNPSIIEVP